MGVLSNVTTVELRTYDNPKSPGGSKYTVYIFSTLASKVFDDTGKSLTDYLAANINRYGACDTAAGTAAKSVSVTGFVLATGARVTVKFTNGNTASSPTLNVSGTGAKPLFYQGTRIADSTGIIKIGGTYDLLYDGANYVFIGNVALGYGN